MFLVVLACLSVRQQNYLLSNERICMKLLPGVVLGPRNKPIKKIIITQV